MGKTAGRIIMWLISFVLFLVTGIVARGMANYGKVNIQADPGVVYSSDEGEIVTSAIDDRVVIKGAVSYRDDEDCMLDVAYVPGGGKKPMIILVHGDVYQSGSRGDVYPLLLTYSQRGYVVASVDYGLLPKTTIVEQQDNIKAAAEYLAIHSEDYEIDPKRVMLIGFSSGAQLAARIAEEVTEDPDRYSYHIVGLGVVSGITDFSKLNSVGKDSSLMSIFDNPEWVSLGSQSESGNEGLDGIDVISSQLNVTEELAKIDVTTNITSDLPPVIIFHGANDEVVPLSVARSFYDGLQAARVTSSFVIITDMDHNTMYAKLIPYLDGFIEKYM
jgi:acetyl esterase/lipase